MRIPIRYKTKYISDAAGVLDELQESETLVRAVGGRVRTDSGPTQLPTYFNPVVAFRDAKEVAGGTVGLCASGFQALSRAISCPPCMEAADGAAVTISVLQRDGSVRKVSAGHTSAHVRKEVVYAVLCVLTVQGHVPASVLRSVPKRQHAMWVSILQDEPTRERIIAQRDAI